MKKGFTLVEIFLAISIFSILAVSIYGVFHMGITAWRKMEAILERSQELRLLMERMGVELRNCLDLDIEEHFIEQEKAYAFRGASNKMIFYTLKNGKIRSIIYKVEKNLEKTEELERDVFLLERAEKPFSPLVFGEDDFQGEVVLDLIKELNFSYLERKSDTEEEWLDKWGENDLQKKNLPAQVKIKIVFYVPTYLPVSRKIDYQEINIEKYVDLVTAKRKLQ
ncbi:MAG: prepilin-type N-terminal cleavage/methylation domain-containing protein [Candidatus Omnitrophica bacterium]|nr:prepilin-type N-terminal cleavage/methylation domain-containing protein [Candidatus Omnitrophota bacterium]